jgi:hypothetical protein
MLFGNALRRPERHQPINAPFIADPSAASEIQQPFPTGLNGDFGSGIIGSFHPVHDRIAGR